MLVKLTPGVHARLTGFESKNEFIFQTTKGRNPTQRKYKISSLEVERKSETKVNRKQNLDQHKLFTLN